MQDLFAPQHDIVTTIGQPVAHNGGEFYIAVAEGWQPHRSQPGAQTALIFKDPGSGWTQYWVLAGNHAELFEGLTLPEAKMAYERAYRAGKGANLTDYGSDILAQHTWAGVPFRNPFIGG